MSYYDPSLNYLIITDASPVGVSAMLLQQLSDSSYRIIAYSSRALTPAEQNYSQLERECLAIVHAFKKSREYILGGHFKITTDHQPLIYLFNKFNHECPCKLKDGTCVYKNLILQLVTLKVQLIQLISCHDIHLT